MIERKHTGFTVIEVMLFLAISGLLISALLIGTGVSISRQRYKDSVTTFQSNLQQVYEEVMSVNNNRDSVRAGCGSSAVAGTSECALLGKLLVIDGEDMSLYDVIGREPSGTTADSSDDTILSSYNPQVIRDNVNVRLSKLEWGASARRLGAGEASVMSLLVLRSPESGFVHTYTVDADMSRIDDDSGSYRLRDDIGPAANRAQRTICVDSDDIASIGGKMAIRIQAGASSATAVTVLSNEQLEEMGGNRC